MTFVLLLLKPLLPTILDPAFKKQCFLLHKTLRVAEMYQSPMLDQPVDRKNK